MALVVQKEPFICFLSVNTGFKAAVDFDDSHSKEWQSIVGRYFHRKLNGGVDFIKTCQQACHPRISCKLRSLFWRASFSSTEHMNAFAISGPNSDPIATPSTFSYKSRLH